MERLGDDVGPISKMKTVLDLDFFTLWSLRLRETLVVEVVVGWFGGCQMEKQKAAPSFTPGLLNGGWATMGVP